MKFRLSGLALTATAVVSGCGLTGPAPTEVPAQSGRISIDGTSQNTESVECTQHAWDLMIDAAAKPGHAEVFLHLGGSEPVVRTVNIQNINDVHGVAGGDTGKAEASIDGNVYTITGTVVGSGRANPSQSRPMPFEIKAPC
ncbi:MULTISPECIES: lipoprotein LpqH [unclassified Mycobacterium]|uniref:lipoprotein LpqH n=1 Tax=unclassified Mycobacterium TaxID=2642494 RepID=UPI0009EB5B12|nr:MULTISPECIES: lipoprotein LpqH [unclassified Mycobacterium]